MRNYSKFIFILFFGAILLSPSFCVLADTTPTQSQLEQQLKEIEQQIAQYETELAHTKTQKATLANKIKQLQAQQKAITLQIKTTAIKLDNLNDQLIVTIDNIKKNLLKEKELNDEIMGVLRQLNAVEDNVVISLATADGLYGAYNEFKNYTALTATLKDLLVANKSVKEAYVKAQEKLEDQKSDASNLLKIKSIQQQGLLSSLSEQSDLLSKTKGKETSYQAMLTDSKKRAAEIRNRIYELFNTGKQINFGDAVDIAKWVSSATGVRPAFLLAILTQESNLGKNVGTCNRAGDPPSKSWKVVMKPTRDQEPFKTITGELGLDIDTTPVSCPMKDKNGAQVGWGGAMGPAQFIPSTWMGYRSKVTKVTGKATANPWDIRDAFVASAIKLKADGADGTDDGDWKAAMLYFSGSTNTKYRFYGDNVIATANKYEADIKEL